MTADHEGADPVSPARLSGERAEAILGLALSRPPGLGATRLVCVDGPAGSGKTTLAAALVRATRRHGLSVALVHMDDVYEGWSGLADAGRRVREQVVEPLAAELGRAHV